jgi:HTH-type transcriptional regulator / antitoxin HigA
MKHTVQINPIKTKNDYVAALQEIDLLFDAKPGTLEADKLDVLTTLVEAYEDEHYAIDFPDPVSALDYWMESRGLNRKDLEFYLGSRSKVSEVLNRKRGLSLEMIRKLHAKLMIPADILIKPMLHHAGNK